MLPGKTVISQERCAQSVEKHYSNKDTNIYRLSNSIEKSGNIKVAFNIFATDWVWKKIKYAFYGGRWARLSDILII